jgi:hypothetical protein
MFIAYVAVSVLLAAALAFSAALDFVRYETVLVNMRAAGVPESWLPMLGYLKVAGALGLLAGFAVPPVGTAAAAGVILFFALAIATHLRARDYSFGLAAGFGLLSVLTLVLGLAAAS